MLLPVVHPSIFAAATALLLTPSRVAAHSMTQSLCSSEAFAFPEILGTNSISISAQHVSNYTAASLPPGTSKYGIFAVDFCNVTLTYTHTGWDDNINVQVWLPSKQLWTRRLQALGGGGYSAGMGALYLTQAVTRGDVAIETDAGHDSGTAAAQSPSTWALTSPGNVNLYLLEDFGSTSLHEMAIIGKAVTQEFYGSLPEHSFFSGCSGGGRQGLMIAQRYPDDFDGILAVAPAINIENFIPAGYWAQHVMNRLQVYPPPCEIDAYTRAAIDHCDILDGVKDGIIATPSLCHFQASSVVGQSFSCNGTQEVLTEAGAKIVQAAWDGPRSPDGRVAWSGLNKDASLTTAYISTKCTSNGTCTAASIGLLDSWIKYFIAKDPDFVASQMTDDQFFSYLIQSEQEYHSMLSAADPDLSRFHAVGGKMITWHGLADEVIPPNGTSTYYQQVLDLDPNADSYYRFFEAPGVGHCIGGPGFIPNDAFDQLVAWVENGIFPDTLRATGAGGTTQELCPYPSVRTYIGGDIADIDSF